MSGQFGFDPGDHRALSEGSKQKSNLPKGRDRGEVPQKRTGPSTSETQGRYLHASFHFCNKTGGKVFLYAIADEEIELKVR